MGRRPFLVTGIAEEGTMAEDNTRMTPEEALARVRAACELASEAPAHVMTLDEKVALASARNIVEACFTLGLDAARKRATAKSAPKSQDESLPGETPAETIARRAAEEEDKA